MGCNQSKGMPACGMMAGTKPVAINMEHGIWRQQGADGKTYFIWKQPCGETYLEPEEALKENSHVGRFLRDGQAWVARWPQSLPRIEKSQEEIRQIARDNGIDIDYKCFQYGTGYVIKRT